MTQFSDFVEAALKPTRGREHQSWEYYAAHFLVGAGLTGGDMDGHVRSLAAEMQHHYQIGADHGFAAYRDGHITARGAE